MILQTQLVPVGFLVHVVTCFYLVRPLHMLFYRAVLTIVPCAILTFVGCQNLPRLYMSSVIVISLYWIITIRLVHLIVFSPETTTSFRSFSWKFLWLFIPTLPCEAKNSVMVDILFMCIKLLLNHWVHRWFLICEPSASYAKMAMFYLWICTGTYGIDAQIVLVRLITRNKYTLLSFHNYPILSKSLREFWGRRYNRFIGSLLKESVFEPVRCLSSSATIAALMSFIVSGLYHIHPSVAIFDAQSSWPTLTFFILQGVACYAETLCPITLPKAIGILVTHIFLLVTAPLYVGLYTNAGPEFFALNVPQLFNATWVPKLPVPKFCPK